jgi:hypothetical protein
MLPSLPDGLPGHREIRAYDPGLGLSIKREEFRPPGAREGHVAGLSDLSLRQVDDALDQIDVSKAANYPTEFLMVKKMSEAATGRLQSRVASVPRYLVAAVKLDAAALKVVTLS